jgi:heme/copper-type cytochrome/quinol oxidase subunit 2
MFVAPTGAKDFQNLVFVSIIDPREQLLLPASRILMKRYLILFFASSIFLVPGCHKRSDADVRIPVLMKKYAIEPAVITLKAGQKVELDVTTADVQHGLDIPELGIKEPVQPGRTTTVFFTAPAKGQYRIACGVICGPHHDDMTGKLVVE